MSIVGELEGLAVELGGKVHTMMEEGDFIDEYWEGDPPSFQVVRIDEPEGQDNLFVVTTSSGNRFTVTVAVAE